MTGKSFEQLLTSCEESFAKSLPKESWYIPVAATLLSLDGGSNFGPLYTYIVSKQGSNATRESRQKVSRRLHEVLIKAWTLVGMPRACDGYYSLARADSPENVPMGMRRDECVRDPQIALQRTESWFKGIMPADEERERMWKSLDGIPELKWALEYVTYGIFQGDLSVLNALETEMAVLGSIFGIDVTAAPTGGPAMTHMRGFRRLGANHEETESVERVIKMTAEWLGKDTSAWHSASEIQQEFKAKV